MPRSNSTPYEALKASREAGSGYSTYSNSDPSWSGESATDEAGNHIGESSKRTNLFHSSSTTAILPKTGEEVTTTYTAKHQANGDYFAGSPTEHDYRTRIVRTDSEGNEVYAHTSGSDELARRVIALTSQRIVDSVTNN